MSTRRSILATVAAAAMVVSLAVSPAVATEEPVVDLTPSQEAQVRAFLTEQAVPADTQDALIAKWEAGQPWDSIRGDVEPVSVETRTLVGSVQAVIRFPDGSVTVQSRQTPTAVTTRGATTHASPSFSCPRSGTASYTGCRIDTNNGVLRLFFYVDFRFGTVSTAARISRAYNPGGYVIGGQMSTPTASVVREYAVDRTGVPAMASASATYSIPPIFTSSVTITLYVFRGNAWTDQ